MNATFLLYVGLILLTGSLWANDTLVEHPTSENMRELNVIIWSHATEGIVVMTVFVSWTMLFSTTIRPDFVLILVSLGWMSVFVYELVVDPRTDHGISAGPGVPFISRAGLEIIKQSIKRVMNKLTLRGKR